MFVFWPDIDQARKLDALFVASQEGENGYFNKTVCTDQAITIYNCMLNLMAGHVLLFFITFYREIFDATQGNFGLIMKIIEVIGTMTYIGMMINSFQFCTVYLGFKTIDIKDPFLKQFLNVGGMNVIPECIIDRNLAKSWLGNSIEWMLIGDIVFGTYTATLIILMLKSRFDTIGMDQSG